MYVKSLKELTVFAFGFNFETLHKMTDFQDMSLHTREQIVQWLFDHDIGILDKMDIEGRQNDFDSEDDALQHHNNAVQSSSHWRNTIFHRRSSHNSSQMKKNKHAAQNASSTSSSEVKQVVSPSRTSPAVQMEHTIRSCFQNTLLFANITRLNVTNSVMLCDELLACFAQQCGSLNSIIFSHCNFFSDEGVLHLVENNRLNKLEWLEINTCHRFNGSSLAKLVTDGHLHSVILRFLRLNWKTFETFLCQNPSIMSLDLRSSSFLGQAEQLSLLPSILGESLVSLVMPKSSHRLDLFLDALYEFCPNIVKLDLTACLVEEFDQLQDNCLKLEELDLGFCIKMKQSYLSEDIPLPNTLTHLGLSCVMVHTDVLDRLILKDTIRNITNINLNGVDAVAYDTNFLKMLCKYLGSQLESLSLSHMELPDIVLVPIGEYCTNLNSLSISGSPNLTGKTLEPLFASKYANKLKKLYLVCCANIVRSVLELVSQNCCNLEKAKFSQVKSVDDEIVLKLAENCSRTLNTVSFCACRQITDVGVVGLAVRCDLLEVNVAGNSNITNRSVIQLARCCPTLKELYISGCSNITKDALTYIKDQCISRLYVSYRNPNVRNISDNETPICVFNQDSNEWVYVFSESGVY